MSTKWKLKKRNKYPKKSKPCVCPYCGGEGPHMIPASMGDPSFLVCTGKLLTVAEFEAQKARESKPKSTEGE